MKPIISLFLLCLLLLTTVFTVAAQGQPSKKENVTLRGTVEDKNGKAIEFCNVVVRAVNDSTFVRGTASNLSGNFYLTLPKDSYHLEVSCIGYVTLRRDITASENLNLGALRVEQDDNMLNEVVVTPRVIERESDKFVMRLSQSPISIGKSSLEILDLAPGVVVDKDGKISMNGKSGTTVMINDRILKMDEEQLAAYLRNIKAEDILKVEVIPNPGAEYDAGSASGILHFTIRKAALEGFNGSVGMRGYVGGGENWRYAPNFSINYSKDKLGLYANVGVNVNNSDNRIEYISDFLKQENRTEQYNDILQRYTGVNGSVGMTYDFTPKKSFGLNLDVFSMNSDNREDLDIYLVQNGHKIYSPAQNHSSYQYMNYNLTATYSSKIDTLGSFFKIVVDGLYRRNAGPNNYSSKYWQYNPLTNNYDIFLKDNIYTDDRPSEYYIFSAKSDYKKAFNKTMALTSGIKYSFMSADSKSIYQIYTNDQWTSTPDMQDHFKYHEHIAAAYTKFEGSFLKRFNYNAGVRLEYYNTVANSIQIHKVNEQNYFGIYPSAYLSYKVNADKGHSLGLSYNRNVRRPSFRQLNPNTIRQSDFQIEIGNPNIQPSYINNFEVNATFKWKYSLSLGYNNYNNTYEMVWVADEKDPNIVISKQEKIGRVHAFYLNASLPIDVAKWWKITMNLNGNYRTYDLLDEKRESLGFNAYLNSMWTLPQNWSLQLSGNAFQYGGQGNMTSNAMVQLNAGVTKRLLKNKNLSVSFSANDFLEGEHHMRQESSSPDLYQCADIYFPGRNFSLSLTYSFAKGKKVNVKKVQSDNEEAGRL